MLRLRRLFNGATIAMCFVVLAGGPVAAITPVTYWIFFKPGTTEPLASEQQDRTIKAFLGIYKTVGTGRVTVTGHTDTSEADVPLSLARAEAVKSLLVELGIPADRITVAGLGDPRPNVQTPPGTREGHNRRVEIILEQDRRP